MNAFRIAFLFSAAALLLPAIAASASDSFVHGIGFGQSTTGGNNGATYTVANLKDSGNGSLRAMINSSKRPALIKFAKCGTIELKSRLIIEKGDLTIDGSSCQNGAGIQLKNFPLQLHNVDNVILSNLALRLGTDAPVSIGTADSSDALEVGCSQDVVLDHLSIYWGTDEDLSFYCYPEDGGAPVTRVSVQYSIIAEALRSPKVFSGKEHNSKGVLIDGAVIDISFYGNLFVSNGDRNPTLGPAPLTEAGTGKTRVQFVNNLLYNTIYGVRSTPSSTPRGDWQIELDIIGNYQKASRDKFSPLTDEKPLYLQSTDNPENALVYLSDNKTIRGDDLDSPSSPTLQILAGQGNFENPIKGLTKSGLLTYAKSPLTTALAPVPILPLGTLEANLASTVGKTLPCRDPIDRRVIYNVLNDVPAAKGGQRPVDDPADVGGYMIDHWDCNP